MEKIRVALLAGGWSGEREVSLKSGSAVYAALDKGKYEVALYDPRDDLGALIRAGRNIDIAFCLLHGRFGEDGCIQGFLEMLGVAYVGSGVLASAIALNKHLAKECYRNQGLKVAEHVLLARGEPYEVEAIMKVLGPRTVVKPVSEGSSLGTSLCGNREELSAGIEKAFEYDDKVMVEEYIDGREITCCIMGTRKLEALPLVEIVPGQEHRFFDYEAKYTPGATKEICPAPINNKLAEKVIACAQAAHKALWCRVWSRTDMIIREDEIFLLETNTIPGMTENSLFPLAARTAGLSLTELVDRLITLSLEERS